MEESSLGRIVGVLVSPAKTFSAIAQRPTWAVALIVLLLLGIGLGWLMMQRIDIEQLTREQFERQGRQVSEEQMERILEFQESFGSVAWIVNPLVFGGGFYLLAALVFWVAFKLVGGDFGYKASLATTLHGFMPGVVAGLLNIPVILSRDQLTLDDLQGGGNLLASNLGALASEDTGVVLKSLLSSIDLFSVWIVVLLTIGFATVGRTSRKTAAVTVVGVWLIGVLLKVGWVALTN